MTRQLVERLRASEPLPVCPFDRLSPHYWTMPDDKPCPFCGQENTSEGPDKCRGADTRIMGEAANEIERLRSLLERCRTVLGNMALENETGFNSIFNRWPISHEPLRADAKGLLPLIDAALVTPANRAEP